MTFLKHCLNILEVIDYLLKFLCIFIKYINKLNLLRTSSMKTKQFLSLTPRQQDTLVAVELMDVPKEAMLDAFSEGDNTLYARATVLEYTTRISCAWELVEKLRISVMPPGSSYANGEYGNSGLYDNVSEYSNIPVFWEAETTDGNHVYARTAALAICLAALKFVGVLED